MNSGNFFNDEILEKRIDTFYGYGNYEGKYWFIGMEEAGGDFQDIENKIDTWSARGSREIDDVAEYHIAMGLTKEEKLIENISQSTKWLNLEAQWLNSGIQHTWRGLIHIILTIEGQEDIKPKDVRQYQVEKLARKGKETCLLELFPLPSPGIGHWIFNEHAKLPFLYNRDTYIKHCVDKRINHISQRIREHQPEVVVFYGMGYEYFWRKIVDVNFTEIEFSKTERFFIGRNNQTVFVMAKHPVARGVPNAYFDYIGKVIADKLAK